jgi:hypothetical protein
LLQNPDRRDSYFDYLCAGLRHPFKALASPRQKDRPTVNPQEFNATKAKLRQEVIEKLRQATREKWKEIEAERQNTKQERRKALREFRELEKQMERKKLIAFEKERHRQRIMEERQRERNAFYASFRSTLDGNSEALQRNVAELEENEERIRRKMQLFIQNSLSRRNRVSPRCMTSDTIDTITEETTSNS